MTANEEGELKVSRTDWVRWGLTLAGQVAVTVLLTSLSNYWALGKLVNELQLKQEADRQLFHVELRALTQQYDELRRDVRELRAPLRGMKLHREAKDPQSASRYAPSAATRRKSLSLKVRPRSALGPSQGGGVGARGPGDRGFPALFGIF